MLLYADMAFIIQLDMLDLSLGNKNEVDSLLQQVYFIPAILIILHLISILH